MYNTDLPTRAELPTTWQLIRSTIVAILAAAAILVTIVLPSEYAIDPTGIGRGLGLTEMGEIKLQLAREAEEDRRQDAPPAHARRDRRSSLGDVLGQFLVRSAAAQTAPAGRRDEMTVALKPDEGAEVKLEMKAGHKASYVWTATGKVNYDLHADGPGNSTSYKKGRGVARDEGAITAAFDGNHGWFWRNRGKTDVTVTLRADGEHTGIKRVK
ncbi:MAG: transmembrane anchor protein [Alphaproteobacteria bacterium]|nr:transmembrane anchor protein [Alphaproteobacteria bacterium]